MQKGFDYLFEKTDQLPSDIAEIVLEFDFTGGFTEIVNKYKLHLDQAEILEDLTFRVMFGELDPVVYIDKLSSELSISKTVAKELAEDTNIGIIDAVKKNIIKHVEEEAEYYKDVELDEENTNTPETTPITFHPKSIYNEPIVDNVPPVHHLNPTHDAKLTHADVLHGIENPHPSIGGNSPIKTASGSKSYADIMGGGKPALKIEVEKPKPAPQVDLIAMKSTAITVSTPTKTETLPMKAPENLPVTTSVDPYKETI